MAGIMSNPYVQWLAQLLLVVGGVAWGIFGLTTLTGDPVNIVEMLIGGLAPYAYIGVGVATLPLTVRFLMTGR